MAVVDVGPYLGLMQTVKETPDGNVWLSYDEEADVLYIRYDETSVATDSELTDDDVIVRYAGEKVVGMTVLHASRRAAPDVPPT